MFQNTPSTHQRDNYECESAKSLEQVNNLCDDKESCKVSASNRIFGDPCPGTYKYLEVNYQCFDYTTALRTRRAITTEERQKQRQIERRKQRQRQRQNRRKRRRQNQRRKQNQGNRGEHNLLPGGRGKELHLGLFCGAYRENLPNSFSQSERNPFSRRTIV